MREVKPTISVIIPSYNRAHLIEKCINSVLKQTNQDFEIIVVDDGSTDETESVVKNLNDKRICYVKHDSNKGVSNALNTGIRLSKGEFISFLGSDDEWLPGKLEKELKAFENAGTRLGVVYSGLWQIGSNRKRYVPRKGIKKKDGHIHSELLNGNFVHGLSLIKKSCFDKVGLFDENLPGLVDWELYLRISKFYEFKFVDEPLSISPISEDSISINYRKKSDAYRLVLKKHIDDYRQNNHAQAHINIRIGSALCFDGNLREGRQYFIRSIKLDHFIKTAYLALFSSFLGKKLFKMVNFS